MPEHFKIYSAKKFNEELTALSQFKPASELIAFETDKTGASYPTLRPKPTWCETLARPFTWLLSCFYKPIDQRVSTVMQRLVAFLQANEKYQNSEEIHDKLCTLRSSISFIRTTRIAKEIHALDALIDKCKTIYLGSFAKQQKDSEDELDASLDAWEKSRKATAEQKATHAERKKLIDHQYTKIKIDAEFRSDIYHIPCAEGDLKVDFGDTQYYFHAELLHDHVLKNPKPLKDIFPKISFELVSRILYGGKFSQEINFKELIGCLYISTLFKTKKISNILCTYLENLINAHYEFLENSKDTHLGTEIIHEYNKQFPLYLNYMDKNILIQCFTDFRQCFFYIKDSKDYE